MGLEFNATEPTVKGDIQILRKFGTKMLVSVSGFDYSDDGDLALAYLTC
jgi:hypothetical protein